MYNLNSYLDEVPNAVKRAELMPFKCFSGFARTRTMYKTG